MQAISKELRAFIIRDNRRERALIKVSFITPRNLGPLALLLPAIAPSRQVAVLLSRDFGHGRISTKRKRRALMKIRLLILAILLINTSLAFRQSAGQTPISPRDAMHARAKSLELNTPYTPPPGEPLEHHASGFAKIMCSAVFITGLDPDFAAENVGYFTAPYAERAKMGKPVVDRANKAVHVTLPNGVRRMAKYIGSQGCVTLPSGKDSLNFKPVVVKSKLPDPSSQPWPMGD